jgi:hypothetical protein
MSEELAKKRFNKLNFTRLLGLLFVMAGAANVTGKLLPSLTPWLGYVLLVNGAVDFFLLPVMLKAKWRNQDNP